MASELEISSELSEINRLLKQIIEMLESIKRTLEHDLPEMLRRI